MAKRSKSKRGRKRQIQREQFSLLELIERKQQEAKELLVFYLLLKRAKENMDNEKELKDVLYYCPSGTIVEDLVRLTAKYTDIYPSITLAASFVLLGAKFTQMGFEVNIGSQTIKPNLWILTLASSGAGKSFILDHVCLKSMSDIETLPETSTAAGYVSLMYSNPQKRCGVLIRDEIGQLFKMMKKDSHLELKDFFLRAYNGTPLERNTKKEGLIRIEDVYISIYGNTVLETFAKSLNEEDLLDGFLQRFMIHIPFEERKKIVPLYMIPQEELSYIKQKYKLLVDELSKFENKSYTLSQHAIDLYQKWFIENFNRDIESYYRRYFFNAVKLSLIITLLNSNQSGIIGLQEMGLALRLITRFLNSFLFLVDEFLNFNDYVVLIRKVEDYLRRYPDAKKRDIIMNVRGVKNVAMLNGILEVLSYENEIARKLLEEGRK